MIDIQELIIITSLALTVPFLCYCAEIMYVWWPSVVDTFRKHGALDGAGMLSRGIWVGFCANFLDNTYWGITWLLVLLQHPLGVLLMMSGALVNIFVRQLGGIIAAREHVLAAAKIHNKDLLLKLHKYYWILGGVAFAVLAYTRFF